MLGLFIFAILVAERNEIHSFAHASSIHTKSGCESTVFTSILFSFHKLNFESHQVFGLILT